MVLRIKNWAQIEKQILIIGKLGWAAGGGGGLVISNRFTYLAAPHEASQNIGIQTKLQYLSLSHNCIFSFFWKSNKLIKTGNIIWVMCNMLSATFTF